MEMSKAAQKLPMRIKQMQALGIPLIYAGVTYQLDKNNHVICVGADKNTVPKNLHILEGTYEIGVKALFGVPSETIYIPDTVHVIRNKALAFCLKLRAVHTSSNLHLLEENAFMFSTVQKLDLRGYHESSIPIGLCMCCDKLREVWCPMETERIKEDAFYKCNNLEKIHLPNRKIIIEKKALYKGDKGGRTKKIYYIDTPISN